MRSRTLLKICLALGLCLTGLVLRVEAQPDPALVSLVEQTPNHDGDGKFTGPSWQEAQSMYDQIISGNNVQDLGNMLVDPGDAELWKVRYVIHGLLTYTLRPGAEAQLGTVIDALVSVLNGQASNEIKKFVILELDAGGDGRAAEALGNHLNDEVLGFDAMRALISIREGAAEQFLTALPDATASTKLYILHGLGKLGDAAAMEAMKTALSDPDVEIRMAAAQALARTGDPTVAPLLIDIIKTDVDWESRMAAVSVLDLVETLTAAGRRDEAIAVCNSLNLKIESDPAMCQVSYTCTDGLDEFLDGVVEIEPEPERSWTTPSLSSAALRTTVFDLQGRVIRELGAYSGDATWDGRDRHGIRVNPGVYIVQVSGPNQETVRMIYIP
jgi:hypothetical protein